MIGEDFLKTFLEFEKQFVTEEMCREYFFHTKYLDGYYPFLKTEKEK